VLFPFNRPEAMRRQTLALVVETTNFDVMEIDDKDFQHSSTSRSHPNNSFTTVNLVDSSTTSTLQTSPSLEPSGSRVTRRRSWGNRERSAAASDSEPSHFEFDVPAPSMSPRRLPPRPVPLAIPARDSDYLLADDPWREPNADNYSQSAGVTKDVFSYSQATPSTFMLMGSPGADLHLEPDTYDGFHEDSADTHLTSNASRIARQDSLDAYSNSDPELEGATPPRSRRKSLQYTLSPSPLKSTENVMKSVSKNLRRMSLRVVNLRNNGLEGQVRLPDGEETEAQNEEHEGAQPDLKQIFPIRGRALGFLGPENKFRLALFNFLVYPYVQAFHSFPLLLNQF